ncbi:MAG TPA: hypothetical protein VJ783_04505 [Pirellulales bacterium]|nr:hypothetical protein [Pirellulales bacterium]
MSCLAAEANISDDALTDRAKSRRRPGRPSSIVEALFATGAYLGTALIAVLALVRILKLWRADLRVPLSNYWDALLTQMWVKGICEHGWYLHNPDLGAPGGMDMHDFPMADNLHFLLLKLLGAATGNWAVAFNLYYLLGFPLAAVTALFALRRFGVSWQSGMVVSLLYAFLPYHFERNQKHLFLASYYLVPLAVMVVLWLMLGRLRWPWPTGGLPGAGHKGRGYRANGENRAAGREGCDYRADRRRFWTSTLVLVLIASAGIYYAFFTCYLLLIAAMGAALHQRRLQPIGTGALLICMTAVGVLVNVSPSLFYWQRHGTNAEVAKRPVDDAEFHGLKIGQLLLPSAEHRVKQLGQIRQRYDHLVLSDGEKRGATLGCVGSAGFLFLMSLLLQGRRSDSRNRLLGALAALNVFAVLLATIGGFGSLFSLLVSPSIRGYNRVSIFIALFCLLAIGVLLDRLAAWWAARGKPAWQFCGALVALAVLGLIDQTGRGRVPDYAALKAQFTGDGQFVAEIERRLAPGAMVYQLPYFRFPEFPKSFALGEYELFRPYLHSKHLRWSYGAMKGRPADLWQRALAAESLERQITTLAEMGFRGVTIDRFGYADLATDLEGELSRMLKQSPLVSPDGRMSFFKLAQALP